MSRLETIIFFSELFIFIFIILIDILTFHENYLKVQFPPTGTVQIPVNQKFGGRTGS